MHKLKLKEKAKHNRIRDSLKSMIIQTVLQDFVHGILQLMPNTGRKEKRVNNGIKYLGQGQAAVPKCPENSKIWCYTTYSNDFLSIVTSYLI